MKTAAETNAERIEAILVAHGVLYAQQPHELAQKIVEAFPELRPEQSKE